MKNKHPPQSVLSVVLCIIGAGLIAFGAAVAYQVPDEIQYIVSAPESKDKTEIVFQEAKKTLQKLSDGTESACITGKAQSMIISTDVSARTVTVYSVDTGYDDLFHRKTATGRMISNREIEESKKVIVIDQRIAYQLFPAGDALGQSIWLGECPWTVVGVVTDCSSIGEADGSMVYIPISTAIEQDIAMQTLEIRLQTKRRDSSFTQIRGILSDWRQGGSFYHLFREKTSAMMPLLWGAVILGCCIIRWLLNALLKYIKHQYEVFQGQLSRHYAYHLIGWICWKSLFVLLITTALSAVAYSVISLIRQTALLFPEWIPEKPVSITSYISRFWELHHTASVPVYYSSQEESAVMLASRLIQWGCFAFLAAGSVKLIYEKCIRTNTLFSGGKKP